MAQEFSYGIVPLREDGGHVEVLLILHRGARYWTFPKGHKNPGETDLETASRELKEETGLEVERYLSSVPYIEKYTFYKFQDKVHKTVAYYPAFVHGSLQLQVEEVLEARWLSLEKALSLLTFPEAREICLLVFKIF
jgi:8-oxo-dGTP pyrophosphatase MutT (NUDIX family)